MLVDFNLENGYPLQNEEEALRLNALAEEIKRMLIASFNTAKENLK